tara:strand:- start:1462 stop:1674 length:213 start_codon:yes stop_codon:yes gene_type:complete
MTLRQMLKKSGTKSGRRWVVKRDEDESIVEVKMIYDPKNYETFKNSKPMVGDKKLVEILDNEYEKKKNNS